MIQLRAFISADFCLCLTPFIDPPRIVFFSATSKMTKVGFKLMWLGIANRIVVVESKFGFLIRSSINVDLDFNDLIKSTIAILI